LVRLVRFGSMLVVSAALVYFSYNILCLLLDPYNVVWRAQTRLYGGLALDQFRFEKTELLRRSPDRYDTIILGNSRGSDNRTKLLSEATGLKIFNYSVSSDYPVGYLMKTRWLLKAQHRLRNVVILLWIDQFWMAGTNYGPLLAREHPDVSGESWWSYYWTFSQLPYQTFSQAALFQLKHFFGLAGGGGIVKNSGVDPESGDFAMWNIFKHLDVNGREWPAYEKAEASDPPGTLRFRTGIMSAAEQAGLKKAFSTYPIQPEQPQSLVETIDLLKTSGVRYHCVIPAMNAVVVGWVPLDTYLRWLEFIVDHCGAVWDFSKPSQVTRNNYNYLDWSHYSPEISYVMLSKVLGAKAAPSTAYAGFGTRVTPDSFAAFAEQFRRSESMTRERLGPARREHRGMAQSP
jgi:hypothetical protein